MSFSVRQNSINLPLAIWKPAPSSAMKGELGFLGLKISGTGEPDSPINFNDSTIGGIVAIVLLVMGLRTPQACLLLWIAVPEDCKSRGSRLPITSLFWI